MPIWKHMPRRALMWARRHTRRTLNRELNHLYYNRQVLETRSAPEVFQVELTNHCPMTCVMCPRTYNMTRNLGYMDRDLFQHIVHEMSGFSSRVFLHHFGESLLHPQLPEFIRHAGRNHIQTFLSINPILLTEDRACALVDSGPHELVISLDGVSDHTNAAIRCHAARDVEQAEHMIRFLLRYRRERRSRLPVIVMQFVRQTLNAHECNDWFRKWSAVEGVDRVRVKSYVTWDGREPRISDLHLEGGAPANKVVCDKPWTSVSVMWGGRVVPCCFDYDGLYVLGDLSQQSLKAIIRRGDRMRCFRRAHRDQKLEGVKLCEHRIHKEGHVVRKWYYPLNRWLFSHMPLGSEYDVKATAHCLGYPFPDATLLRKDATLPTQ